MRCLLVCKNLLETKNKLEIKKKIILKSEILSRYIFLFFYSIDNNHLYCDVKDLTPFVGVDYDQLVKILKRKYRSVDVPSSFRSRMFHAPVKGCFFSVKCFKLLFGKNYIKKVGPGIRKDIVVKQLNDLVEKYTKDEEELEDEEDDDDDVLMLDEVDLKQVLI